MATSQSMGTRPKGGGAAPPTPPPRRIRHQKARHTHEQGQDVVVVVVVVVERREEGRQTSCPKYCVYCAYRGKTQGFFNDFNRFHCVSLRF